MLRIVLVEDKAHSQSVTTLANSLGIGRNDLIDSLYATDEYLSKRLSIEGSLHVERDRFAFRRVAGIFPVNNQLEIEVVPKFMTGDESWRADFLLLLARTRWGILAERQMVSSARNKEHGINDSLSFVFLTLYEQISHVPIRTYRRKTIRQFEVEGDLDEETIFLPEKDGFIQTVTEFTRRNCYNAVIGAAAHTLANSTTDFDLRSRLQRVLQQLGSQDSLPAMIPRTVPSRFRNWSDLYDLCVDILSGYGIDYITQGEVMSPGFVVRTADAWEEFIRQALVGGMKNCTVVFQEKHPFARRDDSIVKVRPDYVLRFTNGTALLADAKYKFGDAKHRSISNADIYEGWAFMKATGISRLVLLYPYSDTSRDKAFEQFQRVWDEDKEIVGLRVNPELMGFHGLQPFASALAEAIESISWT